MKNQIEKMAKEICNATQKTNQGCNSICYPRGMCAHCKVMAEHLYNAGYRKSSDVAREIMQEVRQALLNMVLKNAMGETYDIASRFTEIEKKYIGEDTNVHTNTEGGK